MNEFDFSTIITFIVGTNTITSTDVPSRREDLIRKNAVGFRVYNFHPILKHPHIVICMYKLLFEQNEI
jgi:hypothetical protein